MRTTLEVPRLLDYHCHGCGRRLFQYTPEPLAPGKRMRCRCRDCKTWNELEGPEVLGALAPFLAPKEAT